MSRQVELIVRRPGDPDRRMVLAEGVSHLGRAEDNEIVLADIGVSRRHARITVEAQQVKVEDLGSGNGTFVQGRRVDQHIIADGDEILVEPFTLLFQIAGADPATVDDDETMRAPGPEEMAAAPVRLVVLAGHRLASFYPLGAAPLTMGRSEARDVVLYDPAASRGHCRIERRADGYWLVDLGSANGTYVNNQRASQNLLAPGDRVRIGATEFRFEMTAGAYAPAPPAYAAPAYAAPAPPAYAPPAPAPVAAYAPPAPAPVATYAPPAPAYAPPAPVAAPVQAAPVAPPPVQATPVAPAPVQAAPVQAAPVQAAPVQAAPVQPVAPPQAVAALPPEPAYRSAPMDSPTVSGVDATVSRPAATVAGIKPLHLLIAAVLGFLVVMVLAVAVGIVIWYIKSQQVAPVEAPPVGALVIPAEAWDPQLDAGRLALLEQRPDEALTAFYRVSRANPQSVEAAWWTTVAAESLVVQALGDDLALRRTDDAAREAQVEAATTLAAAALAGKAPLARAEDAVRDALFVAPGRKELTAAQAQLAARRAARVAPPKPPTAAEFAAAEARALSGKPRAAVAAHQKLVDRDPAGTTWVSLASAVAIGDLGDHG